MCNWTMEVADRSSPLLHLMRDQIRAGQYVQIDETPLQVLEDPGSTSQMWVYRGGQPRAPTIFYAYHPSRSGDVPFEFLDGYRGCVQTDGYAGYDKLGSREGVVMLGCWAHARRKLRYNPMLWIGKEEERILRCSPTKMNTRKEYAHEEITG
jgi:transposase